MAKPQLEDGYIKIANEIMEALIKQNLSGQELRLTLFVIRKTYGFNKKEDYISLSQMSKILGLSIVRASQVINRLQQMKIVTLKENLKGKTKKYSFNKDFERWDTLKENLKLKEKRSQHLRKNVSTKDTITKDNNLVEDSKEESRPVVSTKIKTEEEKQKPIDVALAKLLGELIKQRQPENKDVLRQEKKKYIPWAKEIRLMREQDSRDPEIIEIIITLCQKDPFWKTNIKSTGKLRIQYDQLTDKFSREIEAIMNKEREAIAEKEYREQQAKEFKELQKELNKPVSKEEKLRIRKLIKESLKPKKVK